MLFNKNLPESHREGVMGYLEARLADHPFVAGEEFTVGDVAVGSHLLFCKVFLPQVRSPLESSTGRGLMALGASLLLQQLPFSIM